MCQKLCSSSHFRRIDKWRVLCGESNNRRMARRRAPGIERFFFICKISFECLITVKSILNQSVVEAIVLTIEKEKMSI